MALKDGDPISEGYTCVVRERANAGSIVPNHVRSPCDLVDLSTPPKATEQPPGDVGDSVMKKNSTRRNLMRNMNRMANTEFAREMKESWPMADQQQSKFQRRVQI